MVKYLEKSEDFDNLIAKGLVLVDFFADWCGPCKMISPILEELEIDVLKVNVDDHDEVSVKYGVMSIPTLIFFKDGKLLQKEIGFRTKEQLEEIINKI